MRVLLWSGAFWPNIGGVEVIGSYFVRALRDRGHDVMVLSRRDTDEHAPEESFAGIPVVRVPMFQALRDGDPAAVAAAIRAVADVKRRFRPDVVHLYFLVTDAFFQARTAGAWPAPTVAGVHAPVPAGGLPPTLAGVFRDADWVAACSECLLADLRAEVPEIGVRSSTIPNALPADDAPEVSPPGEPVVVYLGRLANVQKAVDLGLRAFAIAAERVEGARLVVAGDGQDREDLERLAADLGLGDRVTFTGWVSPGDVGAVLASARVVLMPSRFEGHPLVALQAARAGRAVLAFDIDGIRDVVEDGVTGRLVPLEDVDALADALTELLADRALAERLGATARERGRGGWDEHVDAFEALYERVASMFSRT
jgi:glycosyltransferase involved in cell wall biosynthesis